MFFCGRFSLLVLELSYFVCRLHLVLMMFGWLLCSGLMGNQERIVGSGFGWDGRSVAWISFVNFFVFVDLIDLKLHQYVIDS